ncbi:hypothetical protein E2C01_014898 [Portunus trituberculatus]|uniref:Uncharacterized protein n=1 Tax=Portunus trituberculatus TaxID=210409 RepID=A0A5B7DL59_PORTR|nr:hypothetical protein [Portunus trituberculatus]
MQRSTPSPLPAGVALTCLVKTKFQRTLSKESKVVARRKDVLLDGVRSNSHPGKEPHLSITPQSTVTCSHYTNLYKLKSDLPNPVFTRQ